MTCPKRRLALDALASPLVGARKTRRPYSADYVLRGSPTKRRHRGLQKTKEGGTPPDYGFRRPRPPAPHLSTAVLSGIEGWRRLVGLQARRGGRRILLTSKDILPVITKTSTDIRGSTRVSSLSYRTCSDIAYRDVYDRRVAISASRNILFATRNREPVKPLFLMEWILDFQLLDPLTGYSCTEYS